MKIHIVKQGDTLYALSQKYGVPLSKIIEANPQISNPDRLEVGGKVKIPASSPSPIPENSDVYYKHAVKQGDTLWKLSKAWGISLQEMVAANPQLKNPNALLIGEVVNIPKKASTPGMVESAQAINMPAQIIDKTQPGGKTYTGPIEQPPVPMIVSPAENSVPENPAPIVQAPEKPVEVAPVQEKPVEMAPVNEPNMHTEVQSLYVQISVPTQEVVSFYEMPPAPEVQPVQMIQPAPMKQHAPISKPVSMTQPVSCNCDKSAGYPGLTENPNFYDCPPAYPLYEPMSIFPMNAPMNPMHPISYEPECEMPFYYPNNMYSPVEVAGPWYPSAMPNYTEAAVQGNYQTSNAAPQYGDPYQNMPWPTSCGCGGQIQPIQAYPNEMPMNNSFPVYTNQPSYPSYTAQMPLASPQYGKYESPQQMYGNPMVSNIPPIPEYPGLGSGNYGYPDRISEFQQVDSILENTQSNEASPVVTEETIERSKSEKATSSPKVTTSSRAVKPSKSVISKTQRSNKSKGSSTSKKRRNPWISN